MFLKANNGEEVGEGYDHRIQKETSDLKELEVISDSTVIMGHGEVN